MAVLRVSSQASEQRRVVGRLGLLKQGLLGLGRRRLQLKVDELGLEQCKLRVDLRSTSASGCCFAARGRAPKVCLHAGRDVSECSCHGGSVRSRSRCCAEFYAHSRASTGIFARPCPP